MSLVESMWQGDDNSLRFAREKASGLRRMNEPLSAHSLMLSAYLSQRRPYLYVLHALYHARSMAKGWKALSHKQLDILLQFVLKIGRLRWFVLRGHVPEIHHLSGMALEQARTLSTKPHQIALAYITQGEVFLVLGREFGMVRHCVTRALSFSEGIRTELDQPQGLRQLVRIFRKSAEIYRKMGDDHAYENLISQALKLAEGRADTPDQARKIRAMMNA